MSQEGFFVGRFLPEQADITEQLFSADKEDIVAQAGADNIILLFCKLIGLAFFIGMEDKVHRPFIAAFVQVKSGEGTVDDIATGLVNTEIKA